MTVDSRTNLARRHPLRVLVIDAHPAIGHGLVRLCGLMPGIQVCGLVTRGEDGITCAGDTRPDVALVDAELPGDLSLATIRALRSCLPRTRIVALGLYPGRRAAVLAAGAHAFAFKDAGFEALRAAIVADADAPFSLPDPGDSASARTPGSVPA